MAATQSTADRPRFELPVRTFSKGLITEVTPLNFTPDSAKDLDNVDLGKDGSISRRLGIDYENMYVDSDATFSDNEVQTWAFGQYLWNAVGGNGQLNFVVVQNGTDLDIYSTDLSSLSRGYLTTVSFSSIAIDATSAKLDRLQGVSGKGRLFFTGQYVDPFYLEYDAVTEDVTATAITLKIRDFEGVDDGLDNDERPATATPNPEHEYNLKNQGWLPTTDDTPIDPITTYSSAHTPSVYPSNAQVWFAGKDVNGDFSPSELDKIAFGTTHASRGHYILEVFDRDRSGVSGVSGLDATSDVEEDSRPRACAFWAGRIWYSGVESNFISTHIYFSQIIDTPKKAGLCYQEADPTSEYAPDIIDTDGGEIVIPETGIIRRLVPMGQSLIIMSDRGIWRVVGGQNGFTATEYSVDKISEIGIVNPFNVVVAENTLFYWTSSGIYYLGTPETGPGITSVSLTQTTIQTLYDSIPVANREFSIGFYDLVRKQVYWLYNDDTEFDGATLRFKYNKLLIFDLALGAFTVYTVNGDNPFIASGIQAFVPQNEIFEFDVVVGGDQVVRGADNVILGKDIGSGFSAVNLYLAIKKNEGDTDWTYTFALFNNTSFLDWLTFDDTGVDSEAFILTGDLIIDDLVRYKTAPYLHTFTKKTESGFVDDGFGGLVPGLQSSLLMQARWGWSISDAAGRWSSIRQVHRPRRGYIPYSAADPYDDGESVIWNKSKVRGKGKALSLKFSSEPSKDFVLYGWAIVFSANPDGDTSDYTMFSDTNRTRVSTIRGR